MSVRAVSEWRFMRHLNGTRWTPFRAMKIDSAFVRTHSNSRRMPAEWRGRQIVRESEWDGSIAAGCSKINTRLICKSCINFRAAILCSVHAVCLSESFMLFNLPSDVSTTRTTTLRATCQRHRSARVVAVSSRVWGNHGHWTLAALLSLIPFPSLSLSSLLYFSTDFLLRLSTLPCVCGFVVAGMAAMQWLAAARYRHYHGQH